MYHLFSASHWEELIILHKALVYMLLVKREKYTYADILDQHLNFVSVLCVKYPLRHSHTSSSGQRWNLFFQPHKSFFLTSSIKGKTCEIPIFPSSPSASEVRTDLVSAKAPPMAQGGMLASCFFFKSHTVKLTECIYPHRKRRLVSWACVIAFCVAFHHQVLCSNVSVVLVDRVSKHSPHYGFSLLA